MQRWMDQNVALCQPFIDFLQRKVTKKNHMLLHPKLPRQIPEPLIFRPFASNPILTIGIPRMKSGESPQGQVNSFPVDEPSHADHPEGAAVPDWESRKMLH